MELIFIMLYHYFGENGRWLSCYPNNIDMNKNKNSLVGLNEL